VYDEDVSAVMLVG
jgi:hypothetical protein